MGCSFGWSPLAGVRALGLILLATVLTSLFAGESLSPQAQRRAAERQARAKYLSNLPEAEKKVQASYLSALAATGRWVIEQNDIEAASEVLNIISLVDEKHPALEELKKLGEGRVPKALDEMGKKELDSRRKKARQQRAAGLAELARSCNAAGLPKNAWDYLLAAIDADPDQPVARAAFGHVKVGDKWHDAWTAAQLQKGLVHVDEMGWVAASGAERFKKGEWLEGGRWMPIADADRFHAEEKTAWQLETAHFSIKATTSRKKLVALAERLDKFRDLVYRETLPFFQHNDKKTQLNFAHAHKPKMNVVVYDDKGDYDAFIKREFKEPFRTVLQIVPGVYYVQKRTLYLVMGEGNATEDLIRQAFQQHETARTIFWETAVGGAVGPKPWLTSAAAGCMMFGRADPEGKWVLSPHFGHFAVQATAELAGQGFLPSVAKMMTLDEAEFNKFAAGDEQRRQICAAFGRFLLEYENGTYANDFCDLLYDSLRTPNSPKAQDYFGDLGVLEGQFLGYLRR